YFVAIGYRDLQNRLGAATPTGAGVFVAQIEAEEAPNAYLPDAAAFPGKTITDRPGGGPVSGHATAGGERYYGTRGSAPGTSQIDAYRVDGTLSSGDWLGGAYLRTGTALAPAVEAHRVQNHSWVATGDPNDPVVVEALRRLDLTVRRDNVVAVVG